ncbi:MAG: DUF4097 family beta strand repeat-containing protein [candidate division KSB1 bacterium]|nr:DUF4097 family beta strand repeat-containing protein [candidate division KSB1 bacterium]
MRPYLGWLVALLTIAQAPALAYTARKEVREVRAFGPGARLEVRNVNGSISVLPWGIDSVEVCAEISVRAKDREEAEDFLQDVEIEIRQVGRRLVVQARHPSVASGFWDWVFGQRKPEASVEFRIRVPKDADLELKTVNGAIEVEAVKGRLSFSTTNGRVEARDVGGEVEASTVNGSVRVEFTEVDPHARMEFKTVNGGIRLYLPENVRADIDASTINGHLETDFPLQVTGKYVGRHIAGSINGGGAFFRLRTVNGGIDILRR